MVAGVRASTGDLVRWENARFGESQQLLIYTDQGRRPGPGFEGIRSNPPFHLQKFFVQLLTIHANEFALLQLCTLFVHRGPTDEIAAYSL